MIDQVISEVRRQGGLRIRAAITGNEVLSAGELASDDDHGLYGPDSMTWRVHGESSMLIGGLRALLLQTLHPSTMAGVADHSDYREDPWGRLHRTGRFVGATTFGSTESAESAIAMVKAIHTRVVGHTPDGQPYSANDPHLLTWVHITEADSFLVAYERYSGHRLTNAQRDRYIFEMAEVGRRLGGENVPTNRQELTESLNSYRRECHYGKQAREAVKFLLSPPVPLLARGAYGVIGAGAIGLLPSWARRMLRMPLLPGVDPLAIRPAAFALTQGIGWLMNEPSVATRTNRALSS